MKYFKGDYNTQIVLGITQEDFLKVAKELSFDIDYDLAQKDFDDFFNQLCGGNNYDFDFICYEDISLSDIYWEDFQNTILFIIKKNGYNVEYNYCITTQFLNSYEEEKMKDLLEK